MSLTGWNVFVNGQLSNHMQANALALLGDPSMWIQAVSWVAAAALLALFCGRGSRPWAIAGAVVAGVAMLAGCAAGGALEGMGAVVDFADVIPVLVACVVIVVCASVAGVPLRPDLPERDWEPYSDEPEGYAPRDRRQHPTRRR